MCVTNSEAHTLKVGDKVWWESTSNGRRLRKEGFVFAVIEPGEKVADYIRQIESVKSHVVKWGGGWPRGHESYLIEVAGRMNAKPRLYWPRSSALRVLF